MLPFTFSQVATRCATIALAPSLRSIIYRPVRNEIVGLRDWNTAIAQGPSSTAASSSDRTLAASHAFDGAHLGNGYFLMT